MTRIAQEGSFAMLWHLHIESKHREANDEGDRLAGEAHELRIEGPWTIRASRGFLVEGSLTHAELQCAAETVLSDPVIETVTITKIDEQPQNGRAVHVMPNPA